MKKLLMAVKWSYMQRPLTAHNFKTSTNLKKIMLFITDINYKLKSTIKSYPIIKTKYIVDMLKL